jgi:hypothetical protein
MDDGKETRPGGGLQFDRAEFATASAPDAAGLTCVACKRTIGSIYYEVNGRIVCNICQPGVETALTGGSGTRRLIAAAVAGSVAALLGALIYGAVYALTTGYQIGLIAILVGYLVGRAVRWGAQARGGWRYQGLAVALTYLSITLWRMAFGVPLAYAVAAPFLGGLEHIMGIVILAIGLYEAWKLNAGAHYRITGPYRIGSAAPSAPAPTPPAEPAGAPAVD